MHSSKTLISVTAIAVLMCAALASGAEFSGAEALQFTRKAVSFGPRPPATEENQKLQGYIKSQLKSFGCEVIEDPFTASTPLGPKQMKNIIARMPGKSGKAVVITGHYDTKVMPGTFFVGANDGGSSAGLLLELAKALCRQPRKNEIDLVWLDGEEAYVQWTPTDSLYGSRHLAQKWQSDGTLRRVKALINVDMIGDKDLELVAESNSSEWLRTLVWNTGKELGYGRQFPQMQGAIEDDHIPFLRAGVSALDLIDFDYGPGNAYWHTDKDTVDKLSAASFDAIGKTLIRVIHKLEE